MTAHNLVTELLLGGVWVDVTEYVRQKSPVTINRGRPNEAPRSTPQTSTFVLDDRDGRFSPRNPAGPYYDQLGRGVQVRQSVKVSADSFTGTSAAGWLPTDTGQGFTHAGVGGTVSATDYSQSGGKGVLSVPAVGSYRVAYMNAGGSVRDVRIAVTVTLPLTNVTGGSLEPIDVLLRVGLDYYHGRVEVTAAESVWVSFHRLNGGQLAAPVQVPGLVHTAAQSLRVVCEIEAQTMRIKVYPAGQPEPGGWHLEYEDTTNALPNAGTIGIRAGVSGGNSNVKPIVFTYDDLAVYLPRFYGDVAKMVPRWSAAHTVGGNRGDRVVAVSAAGALRRLGQGKAVLASAPRRFMPAGPWTLVDHWSLEDGAAATELGSNTVSGGAPAAFARETQVSPNIGAIKFAVDAGTLSASSVIELTNGGQLHIPVRSASLPTSWSVCWSQRISADAGGYALLQCADPADNISFTWYTDGAFLVYLITSNPLASVLLFSGTLADIGYDNVWHTVAFSAWIDGSGIQYAMSIDGVALPGIVATPVTWSTLVGGYFAATIDEPQPYGLSHVIVFPEHINSGSPTLAARYHDAMIGHAGETAGARLDRLCAEHGLTLIVNGVLSDTADVGPQRMDTFVNLVAGAVLVDAGVLYEPKSSDGLAFRTLRDTENQSPAASLAYNAGQVGEPLEPVEDDQGTRNRVTLKRPGGAEYTAELTSGPLSTQPWPDGVDVFDETKTVDVYTDADLADLAWHMVRLGTIDEPRYRVSVELHAPDINVNLLWQLMDVDVDDRLDLTGMDSAASYDDARILARGYTEVFNTAHHHRIVFNGTPYTPYDVGSLDSDRLDSDSSELAAGYTSSAVSFSVASDPFDLWSTSAANYPCPAEVAGEVVIITAVTGATSPQTFTVTRSANGVVKPQLAGAAVHPERYELLRLVR